MDYIDVLQRAIEIINREEEPEAWWSDHGDCCPWCAIAVAKSELDKENNVTLTLWEVLYTFGELDSDVPLVQARQALSEWNDVDPNTITKQQAIDILGKAMVVNNV